MTDFVELFEREVAYDLDGRPVRLPAFLDEAFDELVGVPYRVFLGFAGFVF